jgi:hypothetical protein|uniref:Uncharacterized protein n=1 Tax=Zea mays TaxID=4577 RepID=C0PNI7_MAIZE|nr:unknown [Zea mays]
MENKQTDYYDRLYNLEVRLSYSHNLLKGCLFEIIFVKKKTTTHGNFKRNYPLLPLFTQQKVSLIFPCSRYITRD